MEHGPAAAASRHCLELYTRVYKSRHPSSLSLSALLSSRSAWVPPSPLTRRPNRVRHACCFVLSSLSPPLSHLDPSFNRLCRICLAPLTFPQNPPACQPSGRPARYSHSVTRPAYCDAGSGRRLAIIPRFHFSKSRDIELRLRRSVHRLSRPGFGEERNGEAASARHQPA